MEQQGPDRRWLVLAVFALIAVGVVAAVLIGQNGGSDGDTSASSEASAGGCKEVEAPAPKAVSFKATEQVLKQGEEATAVVKTSCGTFEIALDTVRAPETANSFAFLAEEGFYDDLTFHRIAPGLPPEYALVGKVSEGYDVVERIDALGGPEEKPKQTVLIEEMTIDQG